MGGSMVDANGKLIFQQLQK